jgi:mono/diheme cytochrome c family protein
MRVLLACILLLLAGCDDMTKQRREDAYDKHTGPAPLPAGIVSHRPVPPPPVLDAALLQRGQTQYRIFCTPCHSELGDGSGMIVQRGFPAPPSYHIVRLRDAPTAYFVDVITNGRGAMYSFAQRVAPDDRWAIAAYIRALQHSEVLAEALTAQQRASLP